MKEGSPSEEELQSFSTKLCGNDWRRLARKLEFHEGQIDGFHRADEELSEKAYRMLISWKNRKGSGATYRLLHDALIKMCSESRKTEDEKNDLCKICFSSGNKHQGTRRMTSS